jgi:uncharacterized protein YaiI (UPF0178 family)
LLHKRWEITVVSPQELNKLETVQITPDTTLANILLKASIIATNNNGENRYPDLTPTTIEKAIVIHQDRNLTGNSECYPLPPFSPKPN